MKCPNCGFEQPDTNTECVKCQIVFEKLHARQEMEKRRLEREQIKEKDKQIDPAVDQLLEQKLKEKGIDPLIFHKKPEPAAKPVSKVVIYLIVATVALMLCLVLYSMIMMKKSGY